MTIPKCFNDVRIGIQLSFIESDNSNEIRERYYASLQRIFSALKSSYSTLKSQLILEIKIKDMNDSSGPVGFAPTLFVF